MTDHLNRTKNFTNKEFIDLSRNADGDIIDLSNAFIWITESQHNLLSTDDCARFEDYQEELRILMAEAMAEFN